MPKTASITGRNGYEGMEPDDFPDGSSIALEGIPGVDTGGQSVSLTRLITIRASWRVAYCCRHCSQALPSPSMTMAIFEGFYSNVGSRSTAPGNASPAKTSTSSQPSKSVKASPSISGA